MKMDKHTTTDQSLFVWLNKLPRRAQGWWVIIEQLPTLATNTRRVKLQACCLELPEADGEFKSHCNRYNRWTMAENEFAQLFASGCNGDIFTSVLINHEEEDEGETRTITLENGQVVR